MEYEISDEGVLFDDSTNPSLETTREPVQRDHARAAKAGDQKAVPIPEEEEQFA